MKVSKVDDRRRVCLPPEIPAGSAVTFHRIDDDTWVVKRQRETRRFVSVLVDPVNKLPDDPEWEAKEKNFAAANFARTPPYESL